MPRHEQAHAITAEVSELWVANVVVSEAVCRELIRLPFLEPVSTKAGYLISLCLVFIKHAASSGIPREMGPSSKNCALRVACVDTRDGTPAAWVDHCYSNDSVLIEALNRSEFPEIHARLQVERGRDTYMHRQLNMHTSDNMIDLRLVEYPEAPAAEPSAFDNVEAFEKYFTAGVRNYGPDGRDDYTVVDLQKCCDNRFELMDQHYGCMRTAWGNWRVDGAYRIRNSIYEWQR